MARKNLANMLGNRWIRFRSESLQFKHQETKKDSIESSVKLILGSMDQISVSDI